MVSTGNSAENSSNMKVYFQDNLPRTGIDIIVYYFQMLVLS